MDKFLFILCFFYLFGIGNCTLGVDVSSQVLIDDFQCLDQSGYNYVIIRCYQSTGKVDPVAPHTIYNAWDGGMSQVDVYMFPCPSCGNPSAQVAAAVDYLNSYNAKWNMFWFDIEGPQYWSSNSDDNINFLSAAIAEAKAKGQTVGIYSSASQWGPIMNGWTGASDLPLWYAHYDDWASFGDFTPFGGWNTPHAKQYVGDATVCGVDVDLDFHP